MEPLLLTPPSRNTVRVSFVHGHHLNLSFPKHAGDVPKSSAHEPVGHAVVNIKRSGHRELRPLIFSLPPHSLPLRPLDLPLSLPPHSPPPLEPPALFVASINRFASTCV
eukprot:3550485-Rhodomonas_salina.1